ncbi:MAG: hypothetical protein GC162_15830 [Planctomycetes bacterium]|nr:hypothetical protein [Planctomycetota bacterium]
MAPLIGYAVVLIYYLWFVGGAVLAALGCGLLLFRRTRRAGAIVLTVGLIWGGAIWMRELMFARKYAFVGRHFQDVSRGMTEAQVVDTLGEPTGRDANVLIWRREHIMVQPRFGEIWRGWTPLDDDFSYNEPQSTDYLIELDGRGEVRRKHDPKTGRYVDDD